MQTARTASILGAVLMLLAVAIGAFGAHALEARLVLSGRLPVFSTASHYHFYHALGLLLVGNLAGRFAHQTLIKVSVMALFFGVLIFSGSLYCLAIFNLSWLGIITPIGGTCLLVGWACLAYVLITSTDSGVDRHH